MTTLLSPHLSETLMRSKNTTKCLRYIVTAMLVFVLQACTDEGDINNVDHSKPATEAMIQGEADNITTPNTFVSGNEAVAAEVNDNDRRIARLEEDVANLQYLTKLLQDDLIIAYDRIERLEKDLVDADTSRFELHEYLKQYGYLPGS